MDEKLLFRRIRALRGSGIGLILIGLGFVCVYAIDSMHSDVHVLGGMALCLYGGGQVRIATVLRGLADRTLDRNPAA